MRLDLNAESCSVKRFGSAFQAIDQPLLGNEVWRRGICLAGSHPIFGLFILGYRIKLEVLFCKLEEISAWSDIEDTMRRSCGYAPSHKKSSLTITRTHVEWIDTALALSSDL